MCLWSFRDAALLQLPLKSFTALDAASTFGLLGLLVRPAANKTDWDDHSPPQATPDQQSPLFMRACYCWAAFRNKRKLKSPAVRRHPEVRERARGCEGGGRKKGKKFHSFPAGVFQIPQATALQPCEWSTQAEGKWKRAARGRGAHSWGDASPTQEQNREPFNLLLRLPEYVTGSAAALLSSRVAMNHRDISF